MKRRPRFVLDASALLAVLMGEDGASTVVSAVGQRAVMSVVNWIEILDRLREEADLDPDEVREVLRSRGWYGDWLRIVALDDATIAATVRLSSVPRGYGLSLADRICLGLGRSMGLPILTSDSPMTWADFGAEVKHIRAWDRKPAPPQLPAYAYPR